MKSWLIIKFIFKADQSVLKFEKNVVNILISVDLEKRFRTDLAEKMIKQSSFPYRVFENSLMQGKC